MRLLWQTHSIMTILGVFQGSGFLVAPSWLRPIKPTLKRSKLAAHGGLA